MFFNNAIYIRATINGHQRKCLIDTGSEASIVPLDIVQILKLQPSTRILLAANGTEIRVCGEITIPLRIWRNCSITTKFMVSDYICETMLGMNGLREHRCHIRFGMGALFIGQKQIPLEKGNGASWCRRIVVSEDVMIAPRS